MPSYHGAGKKNWEEVPRPVISEPTDVIAKVDTTTICGTDLHILRGYVHAVKNGRILGHEAVGNAAHICLIRQSRARCEQRLHYY
jgi:alcohol dehydrogenase